MGGNSVCDIVWLTGKVRIQTVYAKISEFDHYVVVMKKKSVSMRYTMKYIGVKGNDVCHFFSFFLDISIGL